MTCLMMSPLIHCLNPDFDLLFPTKIREKEILDSVLHWNNQAFKFKR